MWGREVLLVSFALIALGTTTKCPKRKMSPIREILCYTSALDAQLLADSICSCTTLVHQHYDVRNLSVSHIVDLRKSLKEMHPPLQFVISIYDPEMKLRNSAMARQEAITRIITIMKEVDGVEMNVTAGSKERLSNFMKSLRDEMIRKSYDNKRIFLTLPIKPEDLAKQFDMKELVKYIDLFTLPTDYMTDEEGAFVTFHPSRLMGLFDMLNTDSLLDLISELGAPKQKITMTLPASAYRFALKHETENAPRSQTTERDPTPIDRKQLCEAINDGEWTVERDEDLTAPYAFQNKTWIAFEDKISVGIKGKYALLRDLAGLAVRNIEDDVKTECEMPLTEEIYHSFTEFRRKSRQAVLNALEDELHQTQFSYPNQAKTSNFRVSRVVDTEGHIRAVRESTQTEFVCRRQGYFVHPKSCNRFYRCVKFNQAIEDYSVFEFDCPAGLSFDERTEVCVWPGSLPQGSPCPGSSEIAPVAPKRFECSQPGYYADPQNCRWFFACMDLGESEMMAFEFRCPYGLVFDEKKLVCEWPWLVPTCSESGSAYAKTEYNYGGYTAAGSSNDGYITGGLPGISVTAGAGYSNADYSKTVGSGANYFTGSTAGLHGQYTSSDRIVGSSGPTGIDYSKPSGYGGSVSSVSYTGPSGIQVGSVPPAKENNTGYSASSGKISSTGYTGYTGSSGGITTGFSGSTGYSGSPLTGGGVIYSGRPESSYSVTGGYTGNVGASGPVVGSVTYPKAPNYFASTESPGSSVNIRVDGYSASTGIYSGATDRQTSFDKAGSSFGIESSYPGVIGISRPSTNIYEGPTGAGYSKATSGILQGSTSSDRVLETGYSDASKSVTVGTSAAFGYDNTGHFVNDISSGATGPSSTRYNNEDGYTVPVFLIHGEPIYRGNERPAARPNLNVTIFGNEIPGYDQKGTTGTLVTGSGVQGSIFTSDSYSGTAFSHGNVPGGLSSPAVNQGTVLTGGVPGYVASETSEPRYVIGNVGSASPGTLTYGSPNPAISVSGPSTSGVIFKDDISPGVVTPGYTAPGVFIENSGQSGTFESSTGKSYVYDTGKYSASDVPDYRPTSATLPDSIVSGGRIEGTGSVVYASTVQGPTTPAPGYSSPTSAVFTPSGFTKTGLTKTGITTAVLGGGGSYSVSPSERRPVLNTENISEKAFEGNVAGYTKTSFSSSGADLSVTSTPPDYSSTASPSRVTPQSATSGYSYPKPNVQLGTSEGRPVFSTEGISEKAFEGNVAGYTSSSSNAADLPVTLTPPGYSSTASPSRFIPSSTPGYSYPKPNVQLGTSEGRPVFSTEGISEKAFEGNVAGYTSSSSNVAGLPVTLTPPGYSSTASPSRFIPPSSTSSYSYPKPNVQLGTSEGRPVFSTEGVSEKGFEGNVAGYTSSSSNAAGLSVTLNPPGYSSIASPSRLTPQSSTSSYSYPKPNVQLGTSEGRPVFSTEGISENAFETNGGYKSFSSNAAGLPVTLNPPGYSSTASPSRLTPQSSTSSYSYPKPNVQLGTSKGRPVFSTEGISENAFETNGGYTSFSSNAAGLPVTLNPPGYSSTASPSRLTPQSSTSSYSYPKPSVQLGTGGVTSSSISPIETNLPVTSPRPFSSINAYDGSLGVTFGSKIPSARPSSIPTVFPVVHTTENPEIYEATLFEAAKIPVSTARPVTPLTDDRFIQQTTSSIGLGTSFQRTESSDKKDYGSSLISEYLPAKSTRPGVIESTTRYDVSAVTLRPDLIGVTYKKPSSFADEGSSPIRPTTFRPPSGYYTSQGFSTASSSGTTSASGGSPTNLGISKDKIDKLITNYDRGTIRYTPNVYDTSAGSGFGSTIGKFSSSGSTTASYEVTTKSSESKGKVIVKWSDLHPLLLGKLGAECTCKADPFATLRGPVRKLIDSSRGKVDLANYDESELYVDLGNEGSSEESSRDYDSRFPVQPYKISAPKTTNGSPSSSYLPALPSTTVSARDFNPAIGSRTESPADDGPLGFNLGFRSGRRLKDVVSSPNSIAPEPEEPEEPDDPDQIINGATDCARPGLFRHPSLCNKFYACHWDQWKKKFTLHIFNCPIHLTFDSRASACNWPSKGPACQADNLLV